MLREAKKRSKAIFVSAFSLTFISCNSYQPRLENSAQNNTAQSETSASLLAFGNSNPNCNLWSDWQELCSRTGSEGQTVCIRDPNYKAKPSEPFCTDESLGYDALEASSKQLQSILRYCEKRSDIEIAVSHDSDGIVTEKRTVCLKFNEDRPFNGRSLATLDHPWCGQWSDAVTREPVCQNTHNGDGIYVPLPTCSELSESKMIFENELFCSRRALPIWCAEMRSTDGRVSVNSQDDIVYIGKHVPLPAPVSGVHCTRQTPVN